MIEESFQRELERSAIRGERTSPDAFIGRKGELDRLRSVVDDAEQGNVPLHTRFRLVSAFRALERRRCVPNSSAESMFGAEKPWL